MPKYQVFLNDYNSSNKVFSYKFANTSDITISIDKKSGYVSFSMVKDYDLYDFINKSSYIFRLFRDAFKKIYLFHALEFDCGLKIDTIKFFKDDDNIVITEYQNSNFPFVFSMINDSVNINLPGNWKKRDFIDSALLLNNTKSNKDYRFSALASYISSTQKDFLIDKFSALWTSMNAFYNYVAKCFQNRIKETYKIDNLPKCLSILGNDAASIQAVMCLFVANSKKLTRNDSNKEKSFSEIKSILHRLSDDEISALYTEISESLSGDRNKTHTDHFKEIEKISNVLNATPYTIMIFEYPYYWRCNYFHGNKATTLFLSFADADMATLKALTIFLDRFLSEIIPQIFDSTFFNDEKCNLILAGIKNSDEKEYNKAIKKMTKS